MASMKLVFLGRALKTNSKHLLSPKECYVYFSSLHFKKDTLEKAHRWASEMNKDWRNGKMGNIGIFSSEWQRLRRGGTVV